MPIIETNANPVTIIVRHLVVVRSALKANEFIIMMFRLRNISRVHPTVQSPVLFCYSFNRPNHKRDSVDSPKNLWTFFIPPKHAKNGRKRKGQTKNGRRDCVSSSNGKDASRTSARQCPNDTVWNGERDVVLSGLDLGSKEKKGR